MIEIKLDIHCVESLDEQMIIDIAHNTLGMEVDDLMFMNEDELYDVAMQLVENNVIEDMAYDLVDIPDELIHGVDVTLIQQKEI